MSRTRASARDAGARFESQVAAYLAVALDDDRIERRARNGARDRGDVAGVRRRLGPLTPTGASRIVLELKDCARADLPGWTRKAHVEAVHDGALVGVVVAKRRGVADPARAWVHMELADLVALLTGEPRTVADEEDVA